MYHSPAVPLPDVHTRLWHVQGAPAAVFARDKIGDPCLLVSRRTGGRVWDSPHLGRYKAVQTDHLGRHGLARVSLPSIAVNSSSQCRELRFI